MRTTITKIFRVALVLAFPILAVCQIPQGAHVNLYFPHLADGGNAVQSWQTTFTFVNVSLDDATVWIELYKDDGSPWMLDLGSGVFSEHAVTIPAGGSAVLRSSVASSTIETGWAFAYSTAPVLGNVAFLMQQNGVPQQEITAQATLPTLLYKSYANADLGVALANIFVDLPVIVDATLYDSNGTNVGQKTKTLQPGEHTSFVVKNEFAVGAGFSGSLELSGQQWPIDEFVAWTLNGEGRNGVTILSSLPPGRAGWPISHFDRIWLVFLQVLNEARGEFGILLDEVGLTIPTANGVNALADTNGITVYPGISELISDSPGELAFIIGHLLGHVYQTRTGLYDNDQDPELDADIWASMLAMTAGFEAYSGAGAYGKMAMATAGGTIMPQWEQKTAAQANPVFKARLDQITNMFAMGCADDQEFCDNYRQIVHPHFPESAPLAVPSAPREPQVSSRRPRRGSGEGAVRE